MIPELTGLAEILEADIIERYRTVETVVSRETLATSWRRGNGLKRIVSGLPEGDRVIVFTMSTAHLDSVLMRSECDEKAQRRIRRRARDMMSPDELVARADEAGLAIVAVVPYGLLLGGPEPGLSHLGRMEQSHQWRRTLSWLPYDQDLVDLVLLIERSLVATMPTAVAHRLMLVLDKRRDQVANSAWLEGEKSAATAWAAANAPCARLSDPTLLNELDRLLEPAHGRYLGFAVLDVARRCLPLLDISLLLKPSRAAQFEAWGQAVASDVAVARFMRDWAKGSKARFRRGVDTTLACDYQLVRDVLEDHLQMFGTQN